MEDDKVIIMHGFKQDEALQIMRLVKSAYKNPDELIFAASTPNSLEMKVGDLIEHLAEEHYEARRQKENKGTAE